MSVYAHKTDGRVICSTHGLPQKYSEESEDFLLMKDGACSYSKFSVQDNGDGTGTWVDETDYMAIKTKQADEATYELIQSKVDEFNSTHGSTYKDIYTCKDYKDEPTCLHQQFCTDVWSWNVAVWKKAAEIREDVLSGENAPETVEEYLALLPPYTGVM